MLSDKDIYSLCNGMYNFVNHMRVEKESPFDINYPKDEDRDFPTVIDEKDVVEVIKNIPIVLSSLLKDFQGLEVFYRVKVKHTPLANSCGKREDTREVIDIEMLKDANKNYHVNCLGDFFINKTQ